MSDPITVGYVGVECPECDVVVDVEVTARLTTNPESGQLLVTDSDMTDLWAHMWTHGAEIRGTEER